MLASIQNAERSQMNVMSRAGSRKGQHGAARREVEGSGFRASARVEAGTSSAAWSRAAGADDAPAAYGAISARQRSKAQAEAVTTAHKFTMGTVSRVCVSHLPRKTAWNGATMLTNEDRGEVARTRWQPA